MVSAVVLVWIAPFLTVVTPGAVLSRDTAVALATCLSRVPEAIDIVGEEREVLETEREAFGRFGRRIADLDAASTPAGAQAPASRLATPKAEARNIRAVREAYRETVMSMPHYEDDYGEPLEVNMAAEFGPAVATAVSEHEALTPQLKEALLRASVRARNERASFDRELERERDQLCEAEGELSTIAEETTAVMGAFEERHRLDDIVRQSADDVVGAHRRLEELEEECEQVLQTRQCQLHRGSDRDGTSLQEYLYERADWSYPVIGDALDCLERLRDADRQLRTVMRRLP